jgi:hypothetical protein
MKIIFRFLPVLLFVNTVYAQHISLPNPVMFVAQVPIPKDSSSITLVFSNHQADLIGAGRGSDLYIIYPDGTLKNLTESAGYGMSGLQGANAISVREPSMHWDGKKAIFSMVRGAPSKQGEQAAYFWQLYEITGLGRNETPVITKVPNQPKNYNNVSPIYGTDDRIIFTSDRPKDGLAHLYPLLDERFLFPSTTGLWSLDPVSGDLFQMQVAPSGSFTPFIDSYGRVVFTRWDALQRDRLADHDARDTMGPSYGTFNYSDESVKAVNTGSRKEIFPEPSTGRRDLLQGTNSNGLQINQFFPWEVNEDGTSEEVLSHLGRHDLLDFFQCAINDDPNVVDFHSFGSGRINSNKIAQFILQFTEDPLHPGLYYGTNLADIENVHSSGQIISLNAPPNLDPSAMALTYITDQASSHIRPENLPADSTASGHFRNPLPLTNGSILVSHTPVPFTDRNIGTRSHPVSRFEFRLRTLKKNGDYWASDSFLTAGITKTVSYWDPDTLVSYSGLLWEIDPIEVRARTRPTKHLSILPNPEKQVFIEEGIDEQTFRSDMKQSNLALLVSRNVTHRDNADHQQPYFLKVHNSSTQSANASGKIYDIAHVQLYQADQIRGLTDGGTSPIPGRRMLPQLMHDTAFTFNNPQSVVQHSVLIESDGSFAAFVPPRRAITWSLIDSDLNAVVRERYWVTTQPGEIRVCASCHGTNDEALVNVDPAPQNKSQALRLLLQYWKTSHMPLSPELISPPSDSANIPLSIPFSWHSIAGAKKYQLTLSASQDFSSVLFTSPQLTDTVFTYPSGKLNTTYYWRIQAADDGSNSAYSGIWKFTTQVHEAVPENVYNELSLSNHPNPFNAGTTINFILSADEAIKLCIFNILGEKVGTVADGFYRSGEHTINFDGSHFAEGTYFIQLKSANKLITKAMRIVR